MSKRDMSKMMEREMLHSEHAAQCVMEARRRDGARERSAPSCAGPVEPQARPGGYNRPPTGEPTCPDDWNAGYAAGMADGAAAERERLRATLMEMHAAAKGQHNYFQCAAVELIEPSAKATGVKGSSNA